MIRSSAYSSGATVCAGVFASVWATATATLSRRRPEGAVFLAEIPTDEQAKLKGHGTGSLRRGPFDVRVGAGPGAEGGLVKLAHVSLDGTKLDFTQKLVEI